MSDEMRPPHRRHFVAAGSAAAAAASVALLADAVSAQNNPAANVADRTSTLRIRSLQAMPCGPKVFVKIETNHGITGWGEIDQLVPEAAVALARALFDLLDGENPTRIEHLWQKLFRAHRDMRGGPFMVHSIAGIDMALWDITGKLWGVPVYRLLGGPVRDKIRVYPTAKAQKAGTGGPHPFSGNPDEIQRMVDYVRNVRKQLGPDGTLMFDAHCAMPPPFLIQFAAAIQPFDILFLEEPAVPGNVAVFERLKEQIRIPLATGERDRTIWEMIPYLERRCIDVLQPDCAHTGGISQMRKIAALAEAYFVPLAPHCVTSQLGASASLHVTAATPLFLIHEYYKDLMPEGLIKKNWDVDATGHASLPEGPGLGCDVDEAMIAKVQADPKRKWKWPGATYADGSIRDY